MTVNYINIAIDVPSNIKESFNNTIENYIKVFADPNESLPYNTNIFATIHTKSDEPIYAKAYPNISNGCGGFCYIRNQRSSKNQNHKAVKIPIRPSRSPYNNPVWIVDREGFEEDSNRKKRLIIDFRN